MPVEHLVNRVSIVQCEAVERVTYFHVELDSHNVIVAEGATAETFVDCDSRRMFHNAVEFAVLYPGEDAQRWAFCAPRLDDDPKVEAVWRRLALRAGITVATGPLQGWLDTAEVGLVRGWARDAANSDMPVPVEVVVDGVVLGSTLANRYRADLATVAMATAGTASNSVFPRHSPLTGRICSLLGAQPIAPRSPARRDCCRAPQPEFAVQLKVGSSRNKE